MDIGDNCTNKDAAFQQGLTQGGFSLTSPNLNAKRMNNDIFEVHGGRVIRSNGRKDRHSKVYTARGTRDRRVRLSPQTAISFYDVQDRLGYDRPSKAIDWLMQEAKAAIDALIEPPPPPIDVADIQNVENSNDDYPASGFGFFSEAAAAPSSTDFQPNPVEIFDANLEIARLQRILSWNYNFSGGAPPLICPDPTELGHSYMFSDREPLQSRISSPFPGVGYSSEDLLNFDGAAKFEEDETDIIPDSCNSSFLRIE